MYKIVQILNTSHTEKNSYFAEKNCPEIKTDFLSYLVIRIQTDTETLLHSKNRRFGHICIQHFQK